MPTSPRQRYPQASTFRPSPLTLSSAPSTPNQPSPSTQPLNPPASLQFQLSRPPYSPSEHVQPPPSVPASPSLPQPLVPSSSSPSSDLSLAHRSQYHHPRHQLRHQLQQHQQQSPDHSVGPPAPPPAYVLELAHAHASRGTMSREPSLPSIMSMPRTRPTSPDSSPSHRPQHLRQTSGASSSFPKRQYTRTSIPVKPVHPHTPHQRSLSPASPHFSRRLLTGGAGHLPSSLRTFEEGIRHYERVRSPSLRGHSRRGSWSADSLPPLLHSSSPARGDRLAGQTPPPAQASLQHSNWSLKEWYTSDRGPTSLEISTSDMYDFDLSDDVGEETLRPLKGLETGPFGLNQSEYGSDMSLSDEDACDEDQDNAFDSDGALSDRAVRRARIFKVGERVGVGTWHQGYRVRDLFELGPGNGRRLSMGNGSEAIGTGLLEIVRQIGVGSYAVVYLVREVLYDPDLAEDNANADHSLALHPSTSSLPDGLSETPKASDGFATLLSPVSPSRPPRRRKRQRGELDHVVYGRDFALKCLCKRDLSDELLLLQRGEAELHRALPLHKNIVALHRALETPNWLFLVIEYCPGQDLFYWLEQARDSQDLESVASRASSVSQQLCPPSYTAGFQSSPPPIHMSSTPVVIPPLSPRPRFSPTSPPNSPHRHGVDSLSTRASLVLPPNTPPSPSLLASTADDEMLSRRRLRLISRMFVQMCDAVEACHRVGVCHRDIKPENFIVVDSRRSRSTTVKPIALANQELRELSNPSITPSVVVKITDWGLGTSSGACEDFDCGSKPYMAYECRNNLNPTYDPVQADVWSLGIVLLNLLYHRCPWADPTLADADFLAFRREPVAFLHDRFEGMTSEVAIYLSTRVFCEVTPGTRKRVTAGQFGAWVKDLLNHMGGGQLHASVSDATIAMSPSSARASHFAERILDHRSGSGRTSSLLNGGPSKRSSQLFHAIVLPHSVPENLSPLDSLDSDSSPLNSLDSRGKSQDVLDMQPSSPTSSTKMSSAASLADKGDLEYNPALNPLSHSSQNKDQSDSCFNVRGRSSPFGDRESLEDRLVKLDIASAAVMIADDMESIASGGKLSDKPRRRKRGARKGRKPDGKRPGCETAPVSPLLRPSRSQTCESDAEDSNIMLDDLAEASQLLAREISQTTKPLGVSSSTSATNAISDVANAQASASPIKRKLNIAERMMGRFRDGSNPDFQAFAARAKARDNAYMGGSGPGSNTASAPAKLQRHGAPTSSAAHTNSGISCVSNSTTMSSTTTSSSGKTGSSISTSAWTSSAPLKEDRHRNVPSAPALCNSVPVASDHWASASNRRDRLNATQGIPAANDVILPFGQSVLSFKNRNTGSTKSPTMVVPSTQPEQIISDRRVCEPQCKPTSNSPYSYRHKDACTSTSSLTKVDDEIVRGPLHQMPTNVGLSQLAPATDLTRPRGAPPKTKLAALLTSFKRFNQTVANPGTGNGMNDDSGVGAPGRR